MNAHPPSGPSPTRPPVFSALRIAELVASAPDRVLPPTSEQRRVIEHPLGGSALVVAGAGSGKTETMAGRVVWLVANGLVTPDQVLGLTFTRKAAGELAERVQSRLARFTENLGDAAERGLLSAAESVRAGELIRDLEDGMTLPEISTYDAFAAAIVQEFGVLAGIAPGLALIDSAMAWGLARDTVLASRDPELPGTDLSTASLVKKVLELDRAVSDNQTALDRVERVAEEFSRTASLPYSERDQRNGEAGKLYAPIRDAIASLGQTRLIARLAREYAAQKQRLGLIEFSDQLRLAVATVEQAPEAVAALRRRSAVVLLDEVQDTSVGQARLLASIFGGSSVMAVGDPHQSIYGWRGASADGMRSFHRDFSGTGRGAAAPAPATLSLSVSWRNPVGVLEAANTIAAPLRAESAIEVAELSPRPGASEGRIDWAYPETLQEEIEGIAEWMRDARAQHLAETGEPPTAAVVMRGRRHMAAVSAALAELGIPNRIVGVGGLLSTPEVTDLVCVLRCLWYADAGSELIRILAGPRFRLGVADLAGLRSAARWFAQRDVAQQRLDDEDLAADGVLLDPDRRFTTLDALDEIAGMRSFDHAALSDISETGRARLREAGVMLRQLRAAVGEGVPALLRAAEHALRLDIELDAAEHRGFAGAAAARANLDAFADLVDGFLGLDEHGTLASVLVWLEQASADDDVAEHAPEPEPGAVQIVTIHGAKGLEWDLVAVPRLVEQEFPGAPRDGLGWLRAGQLPDELRGDAGARPRLDWRTAQTQQDLRDAILEYQQQLKDRHADEERRLAYVALTRTASRLLLTGSFWGGQKSARPPSRFLLELQQPGGPVSGLPTASTHGTDSRAEFGAVRGWPSDPLCRRSAAVRRAADLVAQHADAPVAELDPTIDLLLGEREAAASRRSEGLVVGPLAERLTASAFHEFIEDPVQAERRRHRPLPQRPYRRTRLGNRFHEWVERRSSTVRGTELPLVGLEAWAFSEEGFTPDGEFADTEAAQLEALIEHFERSRWADLQPIAVELEITLPFAGRRLVCKLDAVYRVDAGAETRYEIVDWKSGRPPRDEAERQSRFLQLDLYRHAYAQWAGIDPALIDVSLFYVAEGQELRGEAQRSLEELERLWLAAADGLARSAD